MTISAPVKSKPPRPQDAHKSALTLAVEKLKAGQMIEVAEGNTRKVAAGALMTAKRLGITVTTRKTGQGTVRIWRTK